MGAVADLERAPLGFASVTPAGKPDSSSWNGPRIAPAPLLVNDTVPLYCPVARLAVKPERAIPNLAVTLTKLGARFRLTTTGSWSEAR